MSENPTPPIQDGSHLALFVDERGVWVYGNKAGLISLAERLLRIAQADPDECFECHTRSELGDPFGHGKLGEVSLIVDAEVEKYFSPVPDDPEVDGIPFGFELTFMHINETGLNELRQQALKQNQA